MLAPRADVDVNSISIGGRTPLFQPCLVGSERIVAILLEYGADPYIADNDGHTVITLARQKGYRRIVQMLEHVEKSHS